MRWWACCKLEYIRTLVYDRYGTGFSHQYAVCRSKESLTLLNLFMVLIVRAASDGTNKSSTYFNEHFNARVRPSFVICDALLYVCIRTVTSDSP